MTSMLPKGMPLGIPVVTRALRASRLSVVNCRHFRTTASMLQEPQAVEAKNPPLKTVADMPGPRQFPIVKGLLSMLFDKDFDNKRLHIYWKKLVDTYGPIIHHDIVTYPPMVLLTDPNDCEIVNRATMENPVRLSFFSLAKIRKDEINNYFEQKSGLLTENGEEWKRVRSRVQTPMLKAKNVTSYLKDMDHVALEFMDRIAVLQKEYGEMPHNFQEELYKWALESVSLVALSRRMGCLEANLTSDSEPMTLIREANNIFEALNENEFSAHIWRIFPTKAYKRLQRSHAEFLRVADQSIRETEARLLARESNEEELTLMETLLLTPGLSRKDVVTLILDMLFAGIDTTSHTLGFTLYLLARNPQCQAKLQEEVDQVLGDHQGPLTPKHLAQLSYMKAVVKESLRVFPLTIGTMRTLDKDVVLSGYLIPKGYTAGIVASVMCHDERLFPRAKEFIPERWLRHKPLGPIHPYASLPFGIGTRMCIGRRIAEQEIYTFLTRAMQRYSVDYKYQDIDTLTRLVYIPSEPLRFSFTERR